MQVKLIKLLSQKKLEPLIGAVVLSCNIILNITAKGSEKLKSLNKKMSRFSFSIRSFFLSTFIIIVCLKYFCNSIHANYWLAGKSM